MRERKRNLNGLLRRSASMLLAVAMLITSVTLPTIDWVKQKSEASYNLPEDVITVGSKFMYKWEASPQDTGVHSNNITAEYNSKTGALDIVNTNATGVEIDPLSVSYDKNGKLDEEKSITTDPWVETYKNFKTGPWTTEVAGFSTYGDNTNHEKIYTEIENNGQGLFMPTNNTIENNWIPPEYSYVAGSGDQTRYAYFLIKYSAEGYTPRMRVWAYDENYGRVSDENCVVYRNYLNHLHCDKGSNKEKTQCYCQDLVNGVPVERYDLSQSCMYSQDTVLNTEDKQLYSERDFHIADGHVQYQLIWIDMAKYRFDMYDDATEQNKFSIDLVAFEINGVDANEVGYYYSESDIENKRKSLEDQTFSLYGIYGFNTELEAQAFMYADIKDNNTTRYDNIINAPQKAVENDTIYTVLNDVLPSTAFYRGVKDDSGTYNYNDYTGIMVSRTETDRTITTPLGAIYTAYSESIDEKNGPDAEKKVNTGQKTVSTGHIVSGNQGYVEILQTAVSSGEKLQTGEGSYYAYALEYNRATNGYNTTNNNSGDTYNNWNNANGADVKLYAPFEVIDDSITDPSIQTVIKSSAIELHKAHVLDIDYVFMRPQYSKIGYTNGDPKQDVDGQRGYMIDNLSVDNYIVYKHAVDAEGTVVPSSTEGANAIAPMLHTARLSMTYDLGPVISENYESVVFYYDNTENSPITVDLYQDGVIIATKTVSDSSGHIKFDLLDGGEIFHTNTTATHDYWVRVSGCDDVAGTAFDITSVEFLETHNVQVSFNNEADRNDHNAWNFNNKTIGVEIGGNLVTAEYAAANPNNITIAESADNNGYIYTLSGIVCAANTQVEVFAAQQSDYNFAYSIQATIAQDIGGNALVDGENGVTIVKNDTNHVNYKFPVKYDTQIDIDVVWRNYSANISAGMGVMGDNGGITVAPDDSVTVSEESSMSSSVFSEAKASITVGEPSGSITLDKRAYTVGEDIKVTASSTNANGKDWVGIYKSGETPNNTTAIYYGYVTEFKNGMNIKNSSHPGTGRTDWNTIKDLPAGSYKIYLFANDGYTELTSTEIYVTNSTPLATNKTQYIAGEAITVTANSVVTSMDWVGIYKSNETPSTSVYAIYYDYVSKFNNGMNIKNSSYKGTARSDWSSVQSLPAGNYTIYLFANDGYTVLASKSITVTAAVAPTISVGSNSYNEGDNINVTFNSYTTATYGSAWIGIYKNGEDVNSKSSILWANASAGGTVNIAKKGNGVTDNTATGENYRQDVTLVNGYLPAGNYTIHLFSDGGYNSIQQINVTIAAPATAVPTATPTAAPTPTPTPEPTPTPDTSANISVNKTTFAYGEKITINYTNAVASGNNKDWIAIMAKGYKPSSGQTALPSIAYQYAYVEGAGAINFNDLRNTAIVNQANGEYLPAGQYDIYLLDNNGYDNLAEPITIKVNASTNIAEADQYKITTDKLIYGMHDAVNVTVSSANNGDGILLYKKTDNYTDGELAPIAWAYVDCDDLADRNVDLLYQNLTTLDKNGNPIYDSSKGVMHEITSRNDKDTFEWNDKRLVLPEGEYVILIHKNYSSVEKTWVKSSEIAQTIYFDVVGDSRGQLFETPVTDNVHDGTEYNNTTVDIKLDKSYFAEGEQIGVQVTGTENTTWVVYCPTNAAAINANNYNNYTWWYVGSSKQVYAKSGYEFRLFSSGYTVAKKATVNVTVTGAPANGPTSITYNSENREGYLDGTVTVNYPASSSAAPIQEIVLYYADATGYKLAGYTKINHKYVDSLSAGSVTFTLENLMIPTNASKLLVYAKNDKGESTGYAMCNIGIAPMELGTLLSQVSVISDAHVTSQASTNNNNYVTPGGAKPVRYEGNEANFSDALNDIKLNTGVASSGIFIVGDMTDNGFVEEYQEVVDRYNSVFGSDSGTKMYWMIGNHDLGHRQGYESKYAAEGNHYIVSDGSESEGIAYINRFVEQYNNYNNYKVDFLVVDGKTLPCYDVWVDGIHYIFMGSESVSDENGATGSVDATISEAQVDWLEKEIEENYRHGRPVFVMLHQSIYNTVAGSLAGQDWDGIGASGKVDGVEARLMEVLYKYPETIYFSGHSHWDLYSEGTMFERTSGEGDGYQMTYAFNTSSTAYLQTNLGNGTDVTLNSAEGSQGYFVQIYEDKVLVLGYDFANDAWIPGAMFCVEMPKLTVEEDDTTGSGLMGNVWTNERVYTADPNSNTGPEIKVSVDTSAALDMDTARVAIFYKGKLVNDAANTDPSTYLIEDANGQIYVDWDVIKTDKKNKEIGWNYIKNLYQKAPAKNPNYFNDGSEYLEAIVLYLDGESARDENGRYKLLGMNNFLVNASDSVKKDDYPTMTTDSRVYREDGVMTIEGYNSAYEYWLFPRVQFPVLQTTALYGDWLVVDSEITSGIKITSASVNVADLGLTRGDYLLVCVDELQFTNGTFAYMTIEAFRKVRIIGGAPAETTDYPDFKESEIMKPSDTTDKTIESEYGTVFIDYGESDENANANSTYSATQTFTATAKAGYTFVGWFELNNEGVVRNLISKERTYQISNFYYNEVKIYALFLAKGDIENLRYVDFMNDSGEIIQSIPAYDGSEVDISGLSYNVPVKVGYTFKSWNFPKIDKKASYYVYDETDGVTLVESTEADATVCKVNAANYTLIYTREYDEENGVWSEWTPTKLTNIDGNVQIYAQWKPAASGGSMAQFDVSVYEARNEDGSVADTFATKLTTNYLLKASTAASYTLDGKSYTFVGWVNTLNPLTNNFYITNNYVVTADGLVYSNGTVKLNDSYYSIVSYRNDFSCIPATHMALRPVYVLTENYSTLIAGNEAPTVNTSNHVSFTKTSDTKVKIVFNAMLSMGDNMPYEAVEWGYLIYLAKDDTCAPTTTFYNASGEANTVDFLSLDTQSVSGEGSFMKIPVYDKSDAGQYYGAVNTSISENTTKVLYVRPYVIYSTSADSVDSEKWTIGYGQTIEIPVGSWADGEINGSILWDGEAVLSGGEYVNYGTDGTN